MPKYFHENGSENCLCAFSRHSHGVMVTTVYSTIPTLMLYLRDMKMKVRAMNTECNFKSCVHHCCLQDEAVEILKRDVFANSGIGNFFQGVLACDSVIFFVMMD